MSAWFGKGVKQNGTRFQLGVPNWLSGHPLPYIRPAPSEPSGARRVRDVEVAFPWNRGKWAVSL
jgi:hypothetical protein